MTKKELLSIFETLKEFKMVLLDQQIMAYINHMSLVLDVLGLDHELVMRWKILLEEF